jgi:hypothetical protein
MPPDDCEKERGVEGWKIRPPPPMHVLQNRLLQHTQFSHSRTHHGFVLLNAQ